MGRLPAQDLNLLGQVADRAQGMARTHGNYELAQDRAGIVVALTTYHAENGLRLADLLAARDSDFAHDVFGLYRREGRPQDGFSPRYHS